MSASPPTLRRILGSALAALSVGLGVVSLIVGFSNSFPVRLLQGLAVFGGGAVILGAVVVLSLVRVAGWREPESEEEFERIVERTEALGEAGSWGDSVEPDFDEDDDEPTPLESEEDFKALVRSALDELPLEFHRALEHVAVVVSDGGRRQAAYGLYQGDTVARDHFHDRIVIFRDMLLRDFGHDPVGLRAQIVRTVRHELAHHLGWDERGVHGLGL